MPQRVRKPKPSLAEASDLAPLMETDHNSAIPDNGREYADGIKRLLDAGWVSTADSVLLLCAGELDRAVFLALGFENVTISNLDERMKEGDAGRYSPYRWEFQDAEKVTCPDGSFDFVGVHSGLHHCYSPAGAVGEMCRLARKGIFLFEPHDTAFVRLGARLGFGQVYEHSAVFGNNLTHGGVANTALPNFVYRFTRRELEKAVRSRWAWGRPRFMGGALIRLPYSRLSRLPSRLPYRALRLFAPLLKAAMPVFPQLGNNIFFAAARPRIPQDLHPWMREGGSGEAVLDPSWLESEYRRGRAGDSVQM